MIAVKLVNVLETTLPKIQLVGHFFKIHAQKSKIQCIKIYVYVIINVFKIVIILYNYKKLLNNNY